MARVETMGMETRMDRMTEPFGHEERMQAGQAALSTIDALEDPNVYRHLIKARDELIAAATLLRDQHGFDNRMVGLSLMGVVFAPLVDGEGGT
jgi:hypothetical protein